jgi:hypothetical protein
VTLDEYLASVGLDPLIGATLQRFTYGYTDVAACVLNNHDAAAVVFFLAGQPLRRQHVVRILQLWRGDIAKDVHKTVLTKGPRGERFMSWTKVADHGPLLFSCLFNGTISSSYGYVGRSRDSRTNRVMPAGSRRTYWYPTSRGWYASTVECVVRVEELGLLMFATESARSA